MENSSQRAYLDRLRQSRGNEALRRQFRSLLRKNRPLALFYINEDRLRFPTLFLLLHTVMDENLDERLSQRNRAALDICARRLKWRAAPGTPDTLPGQYGPETRQTLKWMFETGRTWEGPFPEFDAYDAVMDLAAAVLIVNYQDDSILPGVAELIFRRNRKGLYIHDLVWSFFRACDPSSVSLLARRLISREAADAELACELLHLEMPEHPEHPESRRKLYEQYQSWLKENRPYLYFTGEQFQLTSAPKPVKVDKEAKYLQKEISPRSQKPLVSVTDDERERLMGFRTCSWEERNLLCEYSDRLHKQNKAAWENWSRNPPDQQVLAARSHTEVI